MAENEVKNQQTEVFTAEYVRELREENSRWRTKVRDLETRQSASEVRSELDKRGIKADPSWVKVGNGQSAAEAVESFVGEYPHLMSVPEEKNPGGSSVSTSTQRVEGKKMPRPLNPGGSNTNAPGPSSTNSSRTMTEIKKDPVARANLREQYRAMLRHQSHQKDVDNY